MGIKYYKQRECNNHALDKVLLLAPLLNSQVRMYVQDATIKSSKCSYLFYGRLDR